MNSVQKQNLFTAVGSFAICAVIFGAVTGLWRNGVLQFLEFKSYDQFVRWQPKRTAAESPVVLIGMTERDIIDRANGGWPLTDGRLAALLERLESHQPAAIGLDLFRDLPVPISGEELPKLDALLLHYTNIIAIRKIAEANQLGILPPPVLMDQPDRIAANDIPADLQMDGHVRRALISLDDGTNVYYSLAMRLAIEYVKRFRIFPTNDPAGTENMMLGDYVFVPMSKHDGGYVHMDDRGYQMLVDFKGPKDFHFYNLKDVFGDAISPGALKNKILILGVTAESVKDFMATPVKPTLFGIEFHGHVVDQILRIVLANDRPLRFLTEWHEFFWLLVWSLIGTLIGFTARTLQAFSLSVGGGLAVLAGTSWVGFNNGWWVPLAVPSLAFVPSAGLVTAFQYHQERKQRGILMTLFGKMVSPQIAETIWIQRGDFLEGQRPRPQRLTATLLFTDMKDFTTACEQMDPTDVTDWLNEYMEIMSKQVLDRGGIINEYIGDSIMATFGIPVPRTTEEQINDDAVSAVKSAVAMAEELDRLNERWKKAGKRTTAMRVGIFTGAVVTGSLGSTERMKYSVVGDTVNTAARLQSFDRSINDPESPHPDCRVLVGDPTWRRLGGRFHGKKVGEFDLKGKKERVTIWQVFNGKLKGEET